MSQIPFLLFDTNVLILYIVGKTDTRLVNRHRRLASFTADDYALLAAIAARAGQLVYLPNVATEASNLLGQSERSADRRILRTFHDYLNTACEIFVPTPTAAARPEFWYLDFTDCALLTETLSDVMMISIDAKLCYNAQRLGLHAVNFNHIREESWES